MALSIFLIAFLATLAFPPLAVYALMHSLLVTEIVPVDQFEIPVPASGDRVSVYGVWVQDTEFAETGFGGWYEIHPVRYMEINGQRYGQLPYEGEVMEGVWGPRRLIILDNENPYRVANGTVAEVFRMGDGDYHVQLLVDEPYLHLLRPNLFASTLPIYQILKIMAYSPIAVVAGYVVISILKPDKTLLGRSLKKKAKPK